MVNEVLDLNTESETDYVPSGDPGKGVCVLRKVLGPSHDYRGAVALALAWPAAAPILIIAKQRQCVDEARRRAFSTKRPNDHVHQRTTNGARGSAVNRPALGQSDEIADRTRRRRMIARRLRIS